MQHSVAVEPSFPLTLTLSLGEREQPAPDGCFAHPGSGGMNSALPKNLSCARLRP